ncbi:hypothetical protein FKM82_009808 [Ascaphus truei]
MMGDRRTEHFCSVNTGCVDKDGVSYWSCFATEPVYSTFVVWRTFSSIKIGRKRAYLHTCNEYSASVPSHRLPQGFWKLVSLHTNSAHCCYLCGKLVS